MITTNDKALVFAKAFSQLGTGNTLHVYVDGVVVFIEGGSDRHLAVRDVLKTEHPGFGEARLGIDSAFVVPIDLGWDTPVSDLPPLFVVTTNGYSDHRNENLFSIEAAYTTLRSAVSILESRK